MADKEGITKAILSFISKNKILTVILLLLVILGFTGYQCEIGPFKVKHEQPKLKKGIANEKGN